MTTAPGSTAMTLDEEIRTTLGMVRLWLTEAGMMDKFSTAVALDVLKMEIQRNVAIVGEASEGTAEKSSNDVISSDGLNLTNITHSFE